MEGEEEAPGDREAEILEAKRAGAKINAALRMCLTPEAYERMANVRMANPDLYAAAVRQILAYAGKGGKKLDGMQVLSLLKAMRGGNRETKITFK